jgi:hypothetical protein
MLVPAEIIQATGGHDLAKVEAVPGEEGDAGDQIQAILPGRDQGAVIFRQHADPWRWVAHLPDGASLHVAGAYQVVQALQAAGATTVPVPAGAPTDPTTWRRSA